MKKVLIFLGLVLLCLFVGSVSAMSGSGTASDPYILTTSADLVALSGTGLAGYGVNSYYELGADIDMSSAGDFTPIGTGNVIFTGYFDGKNHTISNLTISNSGTNGVVSLFHTVNGCSVANLIISDSYFSGNLRSSAFIGVIQNKFNLSNCVAINCIITTSDDGCGGIAGYVNSVSYDSTISNCNIINCYISSTRGSFAGRCGGLVGRLMGDLSNVSIQNCNVNHSTICANCSSVGGIYGELSTTTSYPTITGCTVSYCSISGTSNVAGVGV